MHFINSRQRPTVLNAAPQDMTRWANVDYSLA